uniref:Uncharacterized protein n=1 Tax=viral metagenome TaxID=1070528 RepID=A0A6M3K3R8_9ZZZZ
MEDKLTPKMIKKAVKLLEKHKVKKPYYLEIDNFEECLDFLSVKHVPRCLKLQGYMRVKPTI